MKKLLIVLTAAAAAFAVPAAAQGTGGFQFGLTGGITVPQGDTADVLDNGYHGGLVLNYELPALPLGIRLDGDYHHLDIKSSVGTGSDQIIDGTANVVVGIRILVVKVYALGGAGVYNLKFSGESASAGVSVSNSQTQFGWNAGVGAAFVVGKVSIFVEGRYHEISVNGGKFKFTPVSAGILF